MYHTTKRTVDISTKCTHSYIIGGARGNNSSAILLNPWPPVELLTDQTIGANYSVPYEWIRASIAATVYVNPSINKEEGGTTLSAQKNHHCGKRCGFVEVFRFTSNEERRTSNNEEPYGDYFQCQTEVSEVYGVGINMKDHELSDLMAVRIASSIGADATFHSDAGGAQQINYGGE